MSDLVHLHVHSHYSLLDGGVTIENLVSTAKEMGMSSLALTDHGNMFGAIEFYLECRDQQIKPILGYESYVAPGPRTDKSTTGGISEASYHLTLLVQNADGYRNLVKLATSAYREGHHYRPRIDKEILSQHSRGLIALSGCLSSEVSSLLQEDHVQPALHVIDQYRHIFEPGHFFLEIQQNGILEQQTVNEHLIRISKDTGIPLVATNDIHYRTREDFDAHDVLLCIGTGKLKRDENRLRFERNEFYFKTPEEMAYAFRSTPEAIRNTQAIAEMVDLKLDLKSYHHPVFQCPDGFTPGTYIRKVAEEGVRRRYPAITPEIQKRFDYELEVIEKMGFSSYLLIVWDIVRYAREKGIPVGPGRGSAVGSVVCYSLGITDLDPFRYDLIFERFINPGRNEMPDIDLDFCQARRGEVIDYVTRKYGRDCVCQIITFNSMAAKASLRDVGRVLDVPLAEVDRLAKKVPEGPKVKLKDAVKDPEFVKLIETKPVYREVLETAQRIEGLARNPGIHAAGIVIADRDLTEYCPLYQPPGTNDITSQYDMKMVEKIGLLKIDFLGLATLTHLLLAVQAIRERHGVQIDLERLPLDDTKTYELLGRGEAKGIFQFESEGMRSLLKDARPTCLEDLIALNAMYRPGPMDNIPTFIGRKHGRESIEYLHPDLKPILENTYGVIVYQEQVIRIANRIAGFTLSEGDKLRKAMGKKIRELMDAYKEPFITGAANHGLKESDATTLWNQLEQFAEYGFNKSHAAAYALLAYQTAYLKAHYPAEYMAALLTIEIGNQNKVTEYIQESRHMGIEILPPDVNVSREVFTVVDEGVRFGLGAIRNVGGKAVEAIVRARSKGGPFRSIFDFTERVDARNVNRQTLESLIKAGAFASTQARRSQLLLVLDDAIRMGAAAQADRASGQLSLFGGASGEAEKAAEPPLPDVPEMDRLQLLSLEREMLGFYVSGHPLELYRDITETFTNATTQTVATLREGGHVALLGIVTKVRSMMGRNGRIVRVVLEDPAGAREISVFSDEATKAGDLLAENHILLVLGQIQSYRDHPDIRVSEILAVEDVYQRLAGRVCIRLSANGKTETEIRRLRRILRAHRGECQVLLEVPLEDGTSALVQAGEQYAVSPDPDFRKEVRELLGENAMKFSSKLSAVFNP